MESFQPTTVEGSTTLLVRRKIHVMLRMLQVSNLKGWRFSLAGKPGIGTISYPAAGTVVAVTVERSTCISPQRVNDLISGEKTLVSDCDPRGYIWSKRSGHVGQGREQCN